MKHLLFVCFIGLAAIFAVTAYGSQAAPTESGVPVSGDLIKGSLSSVYYYGADEKRYVFPTEKTYFSWYPDFTNIKTLSDDALASIPLGGNVTYKPGVRLLKITTDPRVYAVDAHGTLRHIATESLATQLYGSGWALMVDDLSDAFFVNYTVGNAINNTVDFFPSTVRDNAVNINSDKSIFPTECEACDMEPPVQATSSILTVSVSDDTAQAGDVITISAQTDTSAELRFIKLFFDGALLTTCESARICSAQVEIPKITTKDTYPVSADLETLDGSTANATTAVTIEMQGNGNHATLRLDRTIIRPGQSVGITAGANDIVPFRIDIYVDGEARKVCQGGARICLHSETFSGNIGDTHDISVIVTDTSGRTYYSHTLTVTLAENDSPILTVESGKVWIYTGETVDVTASASDENGIAWIEILDSNKNVLQRCDSSAPCTKILGPFENVGTFTFYGRASDTLDTQEEKSVSVEVRAMPN